MEGLHRSRTWVGGRGRLGWRGTDRRQGGRGCPARERGGRGKGGSRASQPLSCTRAPAPAPASARSETGTEGQRELEGARGS
eukprot:107498-Rhodomonas_salina.1